MPLPERSLISRIRQQQRSRLPNRSRFSNGGKGGRVIAGIGDDCSVLRIPTGHEALVTTDFSLEGVHFRRAWHPPESIGHRCLARGLSDIAAMGGEPIAAFLSLALPAKLAQGWVDKFLQGLLKLASDFSVSLAGGDTSQSPNGVLADIIVVGSVPKDKAVLRSGARPGDRIYVTGKLGASAATLDWLYSNPTKKVKVEPHRQHFYPTPRIEVGRILRRKGIPSSMIDVSDGLSTDLAHICEESGAGAEVEENAIPHDVELRFALHGGEDYELLFTARPSVHVPRSIAGVQVTQIGHMIRGKGIALLHDRDARSDLRPRGWEHFTTASRRK